MAPLRAVSRWRSLMGGALGGRTGRSGSADAGVAASGAANASAVAPMRTIAAANDDPRRPSTLNVIPLVPYALASLAPGSGLNLAGTLTELRFSGGGGGDCADGLRDLTGGPDQVRPGKRRPRTHSSRMELWADRCPVVVAVDQHYALATSSVTAGPHSPAVSSTSKR